MKGLFKWVRIVSCPRVAGHRDRARARRLIYDGVNPPPSSSLIFFDIAPSGLQKKKKANANFLFCARRNGRPTNAAAYTEKMFVRIGVLHLERRYVQIRRRRGGGGEKTPHRQSRQLLGDPIGNWNRPVVYPTKETHAGVSAHAKGRAAPKKSRNSAHAACRRMGIFFSWKSCSSYADLARLRCFVSTGFVELFFREKKYPANECHY